MVCLLKQHDFSYEGRAQEKSAIWLKFRYQRDPIGNRITSTTTESGSPVIRNYTSNALNQYTAIDNPAQSPTYNDDGCMLNDGTWTYTWDGENRMVTATNGSQTLEFKYDYMGRRVEKRVLDGASETSKKHFVYDGYEQIEELDALNSNAILKKRVWSGGQLISETQGSTTYYAMSDSNKNITEYIDSTGAIQGHFEYSPFGKITVANGTNPDAFDFRFSSEYFDVETGLVYYNFRYYSPELGRWMSRDPIGERGGWNLYGMVSNDLIGRRDNLGLEDVFHKAYEDALESMGANSLHIPPPPKPECKKGDCEVMFLGTQYGFVATFALEAEKIPLNQEDLAKFLAGTFMPSAFMGDAIKLQYIRVLMAGEIKYKKRMCICKDDTWKWDEGAYGTKSLTAGHTITAEKINEGEVGDVLVGDVIAVKKMTTDACYKAIEAFNKEEEKLKSEITKGCREVSFF